MNKNFNILFWQLVKKQENKQITKTQARLNITYEEANDIVFKAFGKTFQKHKDDESISMDVLIHMLNRYLRDKKAEFIEDKKNKKRIDWDSLDSLGLDSEGLVEVRASFGLRKELYKKGVENFKEEEYRKDFLHHYNVVKQVILTDREAKIFEMRVIDNLKLQDIALITDLSINGVKKAFDRAKRKLRGKGDFIGFSYFIETVTVSVYNTLEPAVGSAIGCI